MEAEGSGAGPGTAALGPSLINQTRFWSNNRKLLALGLFSYDIQSGAPMRETSLKMTPHLLLRHAAEAAISIIPS